MASKDKPATQAAEQKAEELEVSLEKVKGSGKDGSVTVADVEEAASEPEKMVRVVLTDPLARSGKGSDGVRYFGGEEVTESHFDSVLAPDKDTEGNRLFHRRSS